ncbi:MAG: hypothetical protein WKG07_35860 [Hymenobacter sp.]
MLVTAIAGYFGWILAQPALELSLDIAGRSGALTIMAQYLTSWAFRLLWAFWDVFQAVEALRLLNAPALPLFFLAILAWLAMWLMPQPILQGPHGYQRLTRRPDAPRHTAVRRRPYLPRTADRRPGRWAAGP